MREVLAWREDGRGLTAERWGRLPARDRVTIEAECLAWLRHDAKANQLVYYQPVSDKARRVHLSTAREFGVQGGNKASKTGTMLAEAAILMTGIVPESLAADYPRSKLVDGPARVRLVVTSLVSAWDTNLKQKFQWFHWNGRLNPDRLAGDPRLGHWGWIPQAWLIDGDWERSWDEKHRVLRLLHPKTREPWSTCQIMSHDQNLEDFNQGAYHLVLEDEIPPEEIHRANRIRVMEFGGRILTGGTPPDDRAGAVAVAWFFDQIIRPGIEGSAPDEVEAVELWTEDNRTLSPADVAFVAKGLTAEQRRARLHGEAIHLAGVVIRGFKERRSMWCFACAAPRYRAEGACETCGSRDGVEYRNVWDDEDLAWPGPAEWPVLFYMDPHQARPTACAWFRVDPQDGWWQIAEAEIAGDARAVKQAVEAFERRHGLSPVWRKADPKITVQSNQFAREFEGRPFTIREAFSEVGFEFDEANTNFTVAIERLEQALSPNPHTRVPQLRVAQQCSRTIYQVTHFTWHKDQPSRQHSDFPALLRYLAMDDPTWRTCQMVRHGTPVSLVGAGEGRNRRTGW